MATLIINDNIALDILTFNQNTNKTDDEKIYDLIGVQINPNTFNNDLKESLNYYLNSKSINKIEIIHNEQVLYSSSKNGSIVSIAFNIDFSLEDNVINGYINLRQGE